MTKLIILTFLILYSTYMWAAANDIVFTQRNSTDTGTFTRFPMVPSSTPGILGFNVSSVLPEWWTLGPGLQVTGTTIDVVGGGSQVNSDWNSVSGVSQILNKPTNVSAFTNDSGYITSSALSPYLTTSLAASTYATQSSVTAGLATKYNSPAGTTAQYVRGDGSLATLPAPGAGTVTSITAGSGLSGGTITSTGTISLQNVGTSGTYSGVSTDSQGRVTSGTTISINDAPGRTLVTSTSATGFQISATRNALACYEGYIQTTSTIGGPASAVVFVETADTNSTTPSDWTTKAQQAYANVISLAVVLNQQQSNNWQICRMIPAGKYVRIRQGSVVGTASVVLNSTQQETLQ